MFLKNFKFNFNKIECKSSSYLNETNALARMAHFLISRYILDSHFSIDIVLFNSNLRKLENYLLMLFKCF